MRRYLMNLLEGACNIRNQHAGANIGDGTEFAFAAGMEYAFRITLLTMDEDATASKTNWDKEENYALKQWRQRLEQAGV